MQLYSYNIPTEIFVKIIPRLNRQLEGVKKKRSHSRDFFFKTFLLPSC